MLNSVILSFLSVSDVHVNCWTASFAYWLHEVVQAALTLSDEAERSRPFASSMGQLMVTQRTSQAAAKQVHSHLLNSLMKLVDSLAHSSPHSSTPSLALLRLPKSCRAVGKAKRLTHTQTSVPAEYIVLSCVLTCSYHTITAAVTCTARETALGCMASHISVALRVQQHSQSKSTVAQQ